MRLQHSMHSAHREWQMGCMRVLGDAGGGGTQKPRNGRGKSTKGAARHWLGGMMRANGQMDKRLMAGRAIYTDPTHTEHG